MRRKFNSIGDDRLLKAAQAGISKEVRKRVKDGTPVSFYDSKKKKVYRINLNGERIYG